MLDYNYILMADSRFISYAMSELKECLGVEGRIKTMALGRGIYLASIAQQANGGNASDKVAKAQFTFAYGLVPVLEIFQGNRKVDELTSAIEKHLKKGEAFRIELVSLGAKRGESAKTTEVGIGQALERVGFTISLKSPQRIIYLVIGQGIEVMASTPVGAAEDIVMDHFRLENKDKDVLNRAEVKIKEAFDTFGLWDKKFGSCLDIGASPGGWSSFMIKRGAKVVAIDKGVLDYDRISTKDIKVIDSLSRYEEGHALLHIKANLDDRDAIPFAKGGFDLLMIDTNTERAESTKIAVAMAPYIRSGGSLIMTIKLPVISEAGNIYKASEELEGYSVKRIKKLHHNRMEVALYAVRN